MSADTKHKGDNSTIFCAGCGIAGVDDVKLKKCACKLVQYCSVECQKDHRPKHKKECKKRAAELRDELLFKQPESSHFGDCPICCLPLSLDHQKRGFMACCSKIICLGCDFANKMREIEARLQQKCPFCRHPPPKSQEEAEKILMKRVEANDPVAMCQMGVFRDKAGHHSDAIEYFTKAVAFGNDFEAHFQLSQMYHDGEGVERNEKKEVYHLEEAAIGGHAFARHNLAVEEEKKCKVDRAIRHWIIAANIGSDKALHSLKLLYRKGLVSKEDFAAALRGYQAAVDATKSPQRERAEQWYRMKNGG